MNCNVCQDKIIENQANNKTFWYCRTCKDERTVWGYELPKKEPEKTEERKVYAKDDLYTGAEYHNSNIDPYYGNAHQPTHLTQKEIDELFADMYTGGAD